MIKLTLWAILACGAVQTALAQQVITLSAARAAGPGATVTVRGVVLNGAELGSIRYMQDQEAGLAAFSNKLPGFSDLMPGDSVELNGTLKNYNGLLEMDPVLSVKKLASKRPLRPVVVPAASFASVLNEKYEGRLVKLTGVPRLTTINGAPVTTLAANTNYLINGQAGSTIRISAASTGPKGLVDMEAPQGEFDLTGLVGQHSPTGSASGYQLLPRLAADMVAANGLPVIVGTPVPTEMSKTTITISFQTLNPGNTKIEYGATPALGGVLTDATPTRQHSLQLTDLQPATTYYIKVSSSNEAGTATTDTVPMITDIKNRSRPSK